MVSPEARVRMVLRDLSDIVVPVVPRVPRGSLASSVSVVCVARWGSQASTARMAAQGRRVPGVTVARLVSREALAPVVSREMPAWACLAQQVVAALVVSPESVAHLAVLATRVATVSVAARASQARMASLAAMVFPGSRVPVDPPAKWAQQAPRVTR